MIFVIGNLIYILRVEKQRLEAQFGQPDLLYKENVPGWIPRWSAWEGPTADGTSSPGADQTL